LSDLTGGDGEEDSFPGLTVSITLARLAYSASGLEGLPSYEELGLADLVEAGRQWQLLRADASTWEWNAAFAGRPEAWREIGLLMGSVGESVMLAAAAQTEIEALRGAVRAGAIPHSCVLALRFFAEGQSHLLISVSHRLTNIALRGLMLAKGYPWSTTDRRVPAVPAAPYSPEKKDWIQFSLSPVLVELAEGSGIPSLTALAATVSSLASDPAWQELQHHRDEDFHRAREESPLVFDSRRAPVWRETGPGQRTLSMSWRPDPSADEALAWADSICSVPQQAMKALAPLLSRFADTWADCMHDLSDGRFSMTTSTTDAEG
jgi:hypothetical protein